MKKILVLAFSMIMVLGSLTAQQRGERSNDRAQRGPSPEYLAMIDSLNLDADQKVQFDALQEMNRKEQQEMVKTARDSGQDRKAMRGEMKKMRDKQTAVLKNLFTDEQYTIYTEFLEKQQASRGNRRGGRG